MATGDTYVPRGLALPHDTDRPEVGSISLRISKPMGATNVAGPGTLSATKTVQVNVAQQIADEADQQAFNEQVGAGPSRGFVGPLQPVYQTKTVATQVPVTAVSAQFGASIQITNFIAYEYHEHYLTPCDSWSCTVPQDALSQSDLDVIQVGAKVEVSIDGQPQSTSYLDTIRIDVAPGGGTTMQLEGRSWIAAVVDAHVDPQTKLTQGMTLLDLATAVLAPFGVRVLANSSLANRNAITGALHGIKTSKKGKDLASARLHQEKPYPQEGAWAFLTRVCNRYGLWPRPAADGKTVILTSPDFEQYPLYSLLHRNDDGRRFNNVIASTVARSREEQPSIIYASGVGGGGEFAYSKLQGAIINPLVAPIAASMKSVTDAYPSVKPITFDVPMLATAIDQPYVDPNARPLFLYDSEAHSQEQLEQFMKRELSLRMRKALSANYTILGHRIGGQPVAVDTMIDVDDDRSNIHGALWVLARRFSKHAGGGTRTQLELIRPGTIVA
jgi:prophage tail gpP-like protein